MQDDDVNDNDDDVAITIARAKKIRNYISQLPSVLNRLNPASGCNKSCRRNGECSECLHTLLEGLYAKPIQSSFLLHSYEHSISEMSENVATNDGSFLSVRIFLYLSLPFPHAFVISRRQHKYKDRIIKEFKNSIDEYWTIKTNNKF